MIKDKIMAIINGEITGGKSEKAGGSGSGDGPGTESDNEKDEKQAPKRSQAKNLEDVKMTDQQLKQMTDMSYEDIDKLTDKDFNKIFGKTNGKPNAKIIDREDLGNGFQAIAVKNKKTGEVVIAFRGSDVEDKGVDWWGQNSSIYMQTKGVQVDSAKQFVERVKNSKKAQDSSITLTGHSLGGFHAQNMAKEYDLPAVTFNAPGLKPHPLHGAGTVSGGWDALKGAFNPNMNGLEDPANAVGAHDNQVVNYVNDADAVGNYGVHYGKVIVTEKGKAPRERNDYLNPIKDKEILGVLPKAIQGTVQGGFLENHSSDSFNSQFGDDGNIAR
ncbi:YqiA/YcfP family alpha/beta fold hydrolase [Paludifilum halophilum]|nr:YqiA/YcfP family alpha/beta fold hydrolase [Paludifilum halophilum]